MMNFHKLKLRLQCLTVFRGLLSDLVVKRFIDLAQELDAEGGEDSAASRKTWEAAAVAHTAFAAALYERGDNLSDYVKELVLGDENPYILSSCSRSMRESPMGESLFRDLGALQELSGVTPQLIREAAASRFATVFKVRRQRKKAACFPRGGKTGTGISGSCTRNASCSSSPRAMEFLQNTTLLW